MDILRAHAAHAAHAFRLAIFSMTAVALGLGGAAGCATSSQGSLDRLPDGNYRLSCPTSLSRCLERADQVCHGRRFTVLGAVDQRDYRGGLDMEQTETRSSRAVVKCGARGSSLFGSSEDPLPNLATPAIPDKAVTAVAKPAERACVPGATQPCVGPAACAGGQACLPDGSGFSPCDCGAPPAAGAAAPAATPAVPGGTPAP